MNERRSKSLASREILASSGVRSGLRRRAEAASAPAGISCPLAELTCAT
jgi:hypothetical protein